MEHIHIVQIADAGSPDTLRSRWSTDNTAGYLNPNGYDECASVCAPS